MAVCLAEHSVPLKDARMAVSKVVTWDKQMETQKAADWAERWALLKVARRVDKRDVHWVVCLAERWA